MQQTPYNPFATKVTISHIIFIHTSSGLYHCWVDQVHISSFPQSCEDPNNSGDLVCVPIVCSISQLQQGGTATLAITSYLDERYFAVSRISSQYEQQWHSQNRVVALRHWWTGYQTCSAWSVSVKHLYNYKGMSSRWLCLGSGRCVRLLYVCWLLVDLISPIDPQRMLLD